MVCKLLLLLLSRLSCVRLCATPQPPPPPPMGFSRQEYWSRVPFPSPGDLPNPGIEPGSPALQADALISEPLGKPQCRIPGFNPRVRKISWRRKWLPTPVFLPREFHRQWSLAGYSPLLKRTENICSQEDLHKTSHRTDLPGIASSIHTVSSYVS